MSYYPASISRCQHIKTNGIQCGSPALHRRRFCFFHNRWREDHAARSAAPLPALSALELPLLEDANSVQIALMQVMRLILKGTNGVEVDIEAIIDTGFTNYLSLPQTWVDALALTRLDAADVTLADGETIQVSIFEGVVVWDGQDRLVEIYCLEGSPLIGMSMLYNYHLSLPVRDGSTFTISLPKNLE